MFLKMLKAAVAAVVLLLNMTQTNACTCLAVYWTPCDYVTGRASSTTTLVVRATALSRSLQTDINDPVTYTVDVTEVFLGDTGGQSVISFVTAGNSAACGIYLELGEEYVLALSPTVGSPSVPPIPIPSVPPIVIASFPPIVNPSDPTNVAGELTVGACGLYRTWSDLPADEKADLEAGCVEADPCFPPCDEYQECVHYERNGKYYCSDTCDNFPCLGEEQCSTRPRSWCRDSGFEGCPERRTCSP